MAKKKKAAKKKKNVKRKKAAKSLWTPAEIKLLRKLFPNKPATEIAAQFKRKAGAVKKKASRMGFRKSKRYMKSLGRA